VDDPAPRVTISRSGGIFDFGRLARVGYGRVPNRFAFIRSMMRGAIRVCVIATTFVLAIFDVRQPAGMSRSARILYAMVEC
jgi:hypothetical protein